MMKKLLIAGMLFCIPLLCSQAQDKPKIPVETTINRDNLTLRPNSRDYAIIRKGNNHQRMVQIRQQAMHRNKQAIINRKMAMEHRRMLLQQDMLRQQNIHQRMIRHRRLHR